MSLPRPSTTSRVAVCAISLIRCEDTNTVRPSAASDLSSSRIQRTPSGSSPLTGSSSTTVLRPAQQRRGHPQPLPHAEGEPPGPGARHLAQPGQLDHLIDPAAADPGRPRQRQQVVARRQARVHRPGVQQDPQLGHGRGRVGVVRAVDPHRPAVRPVQPGDHPHRGGLPRPVRPQEPGHHPRLHHETQPVHRGLVPVPLGQAINLDHVAPLHQSLLMKATLRTTPPGAIYPGTTPFRSPMPPDIGPGAAVPAPGRALGLPAVSAEADKISRSRIRTSVSA